MRLVILLAALSAITYFGNHWAISAYSNAVQQRFVEHLNYIPDAPNIASGPTLNAANFKAWISNNRVDADTYTYPVLFPLDLIFLVVTSCFLGIASAVFGQNSTWFANFPIWVWWIFPTIYLVTDLTEDGTLIYLFGSADRVSDMSFVWLSTVTWMKIKSITVSIIQAITLGTIFGVSSIIQYSKSY